MEQGQGHNEGSLEGLTHDCPLALAMRICRQLLPQPPPPCIRRLSTVRECVSSQSTAPDRSLAVVAHSKPALGQWKTRIHCRFNGGINRARFGFAFLVRFPASRVNKLAVAQFPSVVAHRLPPFPSNRAKFLSQSATESPESLRGDWGCRLKQFQQTSKPCPALSCPQPRQ